jgi:hypothetical protein
VFGIFAAGIGALESLLSIGGTHPWWSLAIFALCVWVLHGLIVFGEDSRTIEYQPGSSATGNRPGPGTAGYEGDPAGRAAVRR